MPSVNCIARGRGGLWQWFGWIKRGWGGWSDVLFIVSGIFFNDKYER